MSLTEGLLEKAQDFKEKLKILELKQVNPRALDLSDQIFNLLDIKRWNIVDEYALIVKVSEEHIENLKTLQEEINFEEIEK